MRVHNIVIYRYTYLNILLCRLRALMPLKSSPNLDLSHTHCNSHNFLIDPIREIWASKILDHGYYRQVIVLSKAEGKMI